MDIDSNPTLGQLPQQRTGVFISYSHKDSDWLEKLNIMLKPLVRLGRITTWDDTRIRGGAEWRKEIDEALSSAKVAVLLVSPDFLASDFIAEAELPKLLLAAEREGLTILWVAVRHSRYDLIPIEKYQAANNPKKPLSRLRGGTLDEELIKICEQIERAATTVLVPKVSAKETPRPSDSSVHLGAADSEIYSRPAQYDPTEYLVDFEDQRLLFRNMLEHVPEKRVMFIQAPGGRGKSSLLRMLGVHCEREEIPYCSIAFGGQPYDKPHFTLARAICNQFHLSPRYLAYAVQGLSVRKPQQEMDDSYISEILDGVSPTNEGLNQRYMKDRLTDAFISDIRQLVEEKGRAVCLFDNFERISEGEEDWLLDALLWPVSRGKLQHLTIVTAGLRWPRINEWEWEQNAHLLGTLPKMNPDHIKLYAEKFNLKITNEDANAYWKASARGTPLIMDLIVRNVRLSERG